MFSTYNYGLDSRLAKRQLGNQTATEYSYDNRGLIARIDHQIGSTSLASIDYQYDANGNRTQQIEQNGRGEERTEYQYDNDDRLTVIHYPDVPQGEGTDVTLTYDQVGNRTGETVYNRSLAMDVSQKTYNYNARHQLISVTDSLNSSNNATWAYDAAGNQTQHISNGVTTTYQYNLRQRMSAVIRDGLTIQTARYDHNGLRIEAQSTTGTKRYSYDGLSPLTVHDGDNHLLMRYHYGAGQLERLFDTQKGHQYYHNDALGSPIVITDANRTAVAYYAYDAFGQYRRQENINTQNIFGFTGHEWDEDTQLLYAKARYYDPDTARFLSQDPFEGNLNTPPSLHKYLYAYQNPTVFVDPDGREAATALEILGHSLQKAPSVSTFTTGTAANAATYETMASRLLSSPGGMATGGILTSIAGPGGAVGLSIASPNKEARIVTLSTGIGDATFDIYSRDKYISPTEEAALRMQYHRNVVYQSDLMEKDTAESLDSRVFLQQNDLSRRTHQNAGGRLLSNQEYMAEVMKEENGTANINVENVGSADAKSVGVSDSSRLVDRSFDVTKVTAKDIPTFKSGKFNEWFDSRTPEEIKYLYESDKRIRRKIEAGLRADGGMHEFLMVSRAPKWKEWGVTTNQVHVDYAVPTEKLRWTIPFDLDHPLAGQPGGHRIVDNITGDVSAPGSKTFHLELDDIISNSSSVRQFDEGLQGLYDRWQVNLLD